MLKEAYMGDLRKADKRESICPLCGEDTGNKVRKLYGNSVCQKCYVGFARRRHLAFIVDNALGGLLLLVLLGSVGLAFTLMEPVSRLQWTYVDKSGNPIADARFFDAGPFSEGVAPVRVSTESLWGYVDRAGRFVIPPRPAVFARPFSEGLALVYGLGYIDKTGEVVISEHRDFWLSESFSEGLTPVHVGQHWGYIDRTGTVVIKQQFDFANSFAEGLAPVQRDDMWGYIDKTGKVVIPCQFYAARPFSEGLAAVQVRRSQAGTFAEDRWVYVDEAGHPVGPEFTYVTDFAEGLAAVRDIEGRWVYIDKTAHTTIDAQFGEARPFSEGLAAVASSEYTWGYINNVGETITGSKFARAETFRDGRAAIMLGGKWGYLGKRGEIVIPPQFDEVTDFHEGIAAVRKIGNMARLIDLEHRTEDEFGLGPVACIANLVGLLVWLCKDGLRGYSPGKAMAGVQVLDVASRKPAGLWASFKRNLPLAIPFMVLIVAFQLLRGPRTGDRWARTRVVWRKYIDKAPFSFGTVP
jgi:hypothetical protein